MEELVKNIKMWRNELERQKAGLGTMSVFDSICVFLGEQQRENEKNKKLLFKEIKKNEKYEKVISMLKELMED